MGAAVVLLSGGMDSTVLLGHLLRGGTDCRTLSIDYGQRHVRELDAARLIAAHYGVEHRVADLSSLKPLLAGSALTSDDVPLPHGHYAEESMKATVVPNRNMLMLAIAGAWAISVKADWIAYAAHAGDHAIYPDCRPEFMSAFERALYLADWHKVRLVAPFTDFTKASIALMGVRLGVPLHLTYSCYAGREEHCGKCGTCTERREAFALAQVIDPSTYEA